MDALQLPANWLHNMALLAGPSTYSYLLLSITHSKLTNNCHWLSVHPAAYKLCIDVDFDYQNQSVDIQFVFVDNIIYIECC